MIRKLYKELVLHLEILSLCTEISKQIMFPVTEKKNGVIS